jgi:hypothetical protein
MDTMRLRTIQVPDRTYELLESFAKDHLRVDDDARRPAHLDDLPAQLRRHVGEGANQQYLWFAWEDIDRIYLITGALALDLARERGRPVLEIRRYDHDGTLLEDSTWMRVASGRWEKCHW